MHGPRPAAFALGLALGLALAAPTFAMDDLSPALPEATMIYARAAGAQVLLDELAASPLVTDGKLLPQVYLEQLRLVLPMLAGETEVSAETWERALFSINAVHFALVGIDASTEEVDLVLAVETDDIDLVRGIIDQVAGEESFFAGEVAGARVMGFNGPGDATWFYAFQRGMLLGATSAGRITSVLEGRAAPVKRSLASRAEYRAGAMPMGRGTTLWVWADLQAFFGEILTSIGMLSPGTEEMVYLTNTLELDRLHSFCAVSGAGATRIRITHHPEHSWLKAIHGTACPADLGAWVPRGSLFMGIDRGPIEKKYQALKTLLMTESRFDFAGEFKKEVGEIEAQLGVSFEQLAKALGDEWAVWMPMLPKKVRIDEDCLTFAFEIKDREAFDLLVTGVLEGPLAQKLAERGEGIVHAVGEESEIFYLQRDGRTDTPCFGIDGNVLLLSGDRLALGAALKARTSGRNLFNAPGVRLGGLPTTAGKHFALLLEPILMDERDFTPLLDILLPGAILAATIDEAPGSLEITVNHPAASFILFLLGGEAVSDRYRDQRGACLSNLRAIGAAVTRYRKERGEDPPSLLALVPDYLEKHRLICPLDAEAGIPCSYEHLLHTKRTTVGSILAYCPHRLHRRIVLYDGGNASTSREASFQRQLRRQE